MLAVGRRFPCGNNLSVGSALSRIQANLPSGFRLFSQPSRVSFQFSFGLLVHYRTRDMFRLGRSVLPYSVGNSGPAYSFRRICLPGLRLRDCHPVLRAIPGRFGYSRSGSSSPHLRSVSRPDSGWPVPLSLAVTEGIAVAFSSFRYSDASSPGVRLPADRTPGVAWSELPPTCD